VTAFSDSQVTEIRRQFPALERSTSFTTTGLGILPRRTADVPRAKIEALSQNALVAPRCENAALVGDMRARKSTACWP